MFNGWVDILFVCGGLFWLLVFSHYALSAGSFKPTDQLPYEGILLGAGAFLLSNSHIGATLFRIEGMRGSNSGFWIASRAVFLLTFVLAVFCSFNQPLLAVLLLLYVGLTIDHTIAQNYGVTVMYFLRGGFSLASGERRLLKVMHAALVWYAILRQLTYRDWYPNAYLGLAVPKLNLLPELFVNSAAVVLAVSTIAFFISILVKAMRQNQKPPLPAVFLLLTSLIMFTSGLEQTIAYFFFIPAFFHAVQYLTVTTFYKMRDETFAAGDSSFRGEDEASSPVVAKVFHPNGNMRYWLKLIAIGAIIFCFVPYVLTLFGVAFHTASIAILVCVSFHHFLADSYIWKLSDARVLRNLIGPHAAM